MKYQESIKRTFLISIIVISIFFLGISSNSIYDSGRSLFAKIKLFSTILEKIQEEYVDEKNPNELIESAIQGMVTDLDPHTSYMTPEQFKEWNQSFEGYTGIGITFDIIRNKITVMSVIKSGPSEKAGLLPGDRIIAINGESALGISRDDVPKKLKGPEGTTVAVRIERSQWKEAQRFVIIREKVHLESIPYAFMLKSGVGYIGIVRFSATTGKEFIEALDKLKSQGMKQLILDLRNNGGGYLEAAVQVADQLLPENKMIVYTQGRKKSSFYPFESTAQGAFKSLPIIVLVDRISASASEIVAGALQDWDRALILGETSFGKGLVQTQYRFSDGSALMMTTARYYTPGGRLIQRPYNNKTLEEYFIDITNDSLRKAWEKDPSRPIHKTLILKRDVYGGGGITPDHFLTVRRDTLNRLVREMYFDSNRYFYTFSDDYLKKHPEMKVDFNNFLRNFKANGKILQQFVGYIREMGFEITNQQILENSQDIQFLLKQTIAGVLWGEEERYKVQMLRDHQILEALEYLPEAESQLYKAYQISNRRNGSIRG